MWLKWFLKDIFPFASTIDTDEGSRSWQCYKCLHYSLEAYTLATLSQARAPKSSPKALNTKP